MIKINFFPSFPANKFFSLIGLMICWGHLGSAQVTSKNKLDAELSQGFDKASDREVVDSGLPNSKQNLRPPPKVSSNSAPESAPANSPGSGLSANETLKKDLISTNKDGGYLYKVKLKERSKSALFKATQISPPEIVNPKTNSTYKSVYKNQSILTASGLYDFSPIKSFKSLSVQFGFGFGQVLGEGVLGDATGTSSKEVYTLFVIPVDLFVSLRLQTWARQWVVPYVLAGTTYYGLIEKRNDSKGPVVSGSLAWVGGGGLMISLSRYSQRSSFIMTNDYGFSDLWLFLEALAAQSFASDINFTSSQLSAGLTLDY